MSTDQQGYYKYDPILLRAYVTDSDMKAKLRGVRSYVTDSDMATMRRGVKLTVNVHLPSDQTVAVTMEEVLVHSCGPRVACRWVQGTVVLSGGGL